MNAFYAFLFIIIGFIGFLSNQSKAHDNTISNEIASGPPYDSSSALQTGKVGDDRNAQTTTTTTSSSLAPDEDSERKSRREGRYIRQWPSSSYNNHPQYRFRPGASNRFPSNKRRGNKQPPASHMRGYGYGYGSVRNHHNHQQPFYRTNFGHDNSNNNNRYNHFDSDRYQSQHRYRPGGYKQWLDHYADYDQQNQLLDEQPEDYEDMVMPVEGASDFKEQYEELPAPYRRLRPNGIGPGRLPSSMYRRIALRRPSAAALSDGGMISWPKPSAPVHMVDEYFPYAAAAAAIRPPVDYSGYSHTVDLYSEQDRPYDRGRFDQNQIYRASKLKNEAAAAADVYYGGAAGRKPVQQSLRAYYNNPRNKDSNDNAPLLSDDIGSNIPFRMSLTAGLGANNHNNNNGSPVQNRKPISAERDEQQLAKDEAVYSARYRSTQSQTFNKEGKFSRPGSKRPMGADHTSALDHRQKEGEIESANDPLIDDGVNVTDDNERGGRNPDNDDDNDDDDDDDLLSSHFIAYTSAHPSDNVVVGKGSRYVDSSGRAAGTRARARPTKRSKPNAHYSDIPPPDSSINIEPQASALDQDIEITFDERMMSDWKDIE